MSNSPGGLGDTGGVENHGGRDIFSLKEITTHSTFSELYYAQLATTVKGQGVLLFIPIFNRLSSEAKL